MVRRNEQAGWIAAIFAGGSAGTAIRAALESAAPHDAGQWPWATFAINISGAFILAALLEYLALTGPDEGWRKLIRLGVGTGVLGGFTTYSTFAVETVEAMQAGAYGIALLYSCGSIAGGCLAAYCAIGGIRALHNHRLGARGSEK